MEEIKAKSSVEEKKEGIPFFKILCRSWILILCIVIACGILGTVFGVFTAKTTYTAKSNVMLKVHLESSGTESITSNTSFAKKYLPTIADVIKSPAIVNKAKTIGEKDEGITAGAVSVNYDSDSLIFSISYKDGDKDKAVERLNKIIEAASISFRQDKPIAVESIELVKMQNEFSVSSSSGFSKYISLSILAGIIIGVLVAVMIYVLDNKIKDEKELEELTGVSVLSYISPVPESSK